MDAVSYGKALAKAKKDYYENVNKLRNAHRQDKKQSAALNQYLRKKQSDSHEGQKLEMEKQNAFLMDDMSRKTTRSLREAKKGMQQNMDEVRHKFNKDRKFLKQDYDREVAQIKEIYNKNINDERDLHDRALTSNLKRFKEHRKSQEHRHVEEMDEFGKRVHDSNELLRRENKLRISDLSNKSQSEKEAIRREEGLSKIKQKTKLVTNLNNLRDVKDHELMTNKKRAKAVLDNSNRKHVKHSKDMEQNYVELTDEMRDRMNRHNDRLQRRHRREVATKNRATKGEMADLNRRIHALSKRGFGTEAVPKADYEKLDDNWRHKYKRLKTSLKDLQTRNEDMSSNQSDVIKDTLKESKIKMSQKYLEQEEAFNKMQKDFIKRDRREKSNLINSFQNQILSERRTHESLQRDLKSRQRLLSEAQRNNFSNTVKFMNKNLKDQAAKMKESHTNEVQSLNSKSAFEKNLIRKEMLDKANQDLAAKESSLGSVIDLKKKELARTKQLSKVKFNRLIAETSGQLKDMEQMNDDRQKFDLQNMRDRLREQREKYEVRIARLKGDMARSISKLGFRHEREMREMTDHYELQMKEMAKQTRREKMQMSKDYKSKTTTISNSFKKSKITLINQYERRIQKMQQEFDNRMSDVNKTLREAIAQKESKADNKA